MRKKSLLKVAGGTVGLIVVLVTAVVVYVAANVDEFTELVVSEVKKATARELRVGKAHLVPALTPTVALDEVSFANASWGSEPEMITAARIEASVSLLSLLSGSIVVRDFILVEPDILLEKDAEGNANWELAPAADKPVEPVSDDTSESAAPDLAVQRVSIQKGRLRYRDGATEAVTSLLIDKLSANSDDHDSPLSVELAAEFNGTPVDLRASLGAVRTLLANRSFPVDVNVNAAGAELTIKGTLERPLEGRGLALDLRMNLESLTELSALAGAELPPLGAIAFTGRLSDEETGYRLEGVDAKVGESDISGTLAVALAGERPKVSATLSSKNVDLTGLAGTPGGSAPASPTEDTGRVLPSDPLPLDALRAFDADLSFQAARLLAPSISAEQVDLALALDAGRVMLKPAKARVAGGALDAELELNAGTETATMTTTIKASQVSLGQLFKETKGTEILSGGNTDVDITLSGQGNSIAALAASLNGKLIVLVGEGRIQNDLLDMAGADVGFQILGKLNPFAQQEKHTAMQCAVLRYDIKNGLATSNNGIAFETDKMEILGAGTINLQNEALNLVIESKGKEGVVLTGVKTLTGVKGVSIAGLVQVRGTLAAPTVELNPEGLLKQGASTTAAIATGGLSLLAEQLFQQTTNPASACSIARQEAPAATSSSGQSETKQQTEQEEPKEEGGIGGVIKGIFGN